MLFDKFKEIILEELNNCTKDLKDYITKNELELDFEFELPFDNNAIVNLLLIYKDKSFLFNQKFPNRSQELVFLSSLNEGQKSVVFELLHSVDYMNDRLRTMF